MLSSSRSVLLRASGSSSGTIAPSISSCLVMQKRFDSQSRSKQDVRITKKQSKVPVRDKVSGAFLPLPPNQLANLTLEDGSKLAHSTDGLSQLPVLPKGEYPAEIVGKALQLPHGQSKLLRTLGLPRNILVDFRLLSSPCSIQRKSTLELTRWLEKADARPASKNRIVLTGVPGSGKSYLLLQAVSYCALNDWITLYIPRAHTMVDSSSSYIYDARTQTYSQPGFSSQLLKRLLATNGEAFKALQLSQPVEFEKRQSVPAGSSLKDLIEVASTDPHLAPAILSTIFDLLGNQDIYPVLLAVDEMQALYCKTKYRDQHFEQIKSYHLSAPRLIMEYISGMKQFARGAVVSAISSSQTHFPVSSELTKALNLTPNQVLDPYEKLNPNMLAYAEGLQTLRVPEKLELEEASSLFEVWKSDNALHTWDDDALFLSKYSEAAGNPRDFVHGGLLATQTS